MGRAGVGTFSLWLCSVVCLAHGQNYVNVARGKTYSQSSKYYPDDDSGKAANGITGGVYPSNCIHTLAGDTGDPWWEVDLGTIYTLYNITVWARPAVPQRLFPFTITVDGQTCGSASTVQNMTNVTCSGFIRGQTVRITRNVPQGNIGDERTLNMCELEIWDCTAGWYGTQCSSACSPGCQNIACDRQSAQCSPCKTGYAGNTCSDCTAGWYGTQCASACSPGCQSIACDRQSAQCSSCKTGYTGYTCSECQKGYYKLTNGTCVQCSAGCDNQGCEALTGRCKSCEDGHYGDVCIGTCPTSHCQRCTQDTGECTLCADSNLQPPNCTDVTDADTSDANCVSVGAMVGVGFAGLFIGAGLVILAGAIWIHHRTRRSEGRKTSTDKTEATPSTAVPANWTRTTVAFQGLAEQEGHYKRVTDMSMTPKNTHPATSDHHDTTHVHPVSSTAADITPSTYIQPVVSADAVNPSLVTDADNPYDRPAVQYSNIGEVHIYDPWQASRVDQPANITDKASNGST